MSVVLDPFTDIIEVGWPQNYIILPYQIGVNWSSHGFVACTPDRVGPPSQGAYYDSLSDIASTFTVWTGFTDYWSGNAKSAWYQGQVSELLMSDLSGFPAPASESFSQWQYTQTTAQGGGFDTDATFTLSMNGGPTINEVQTVPQLPFSGGDRMQFPKASFSGSIGSTAHPMTTYDACIQSAFFPDFRQYYNSDWLTFDTILFDGFTFNNASFVINPDNTGGKPPQRFRYVGFSLAIGEDLTEEKLITQAPAINYLWFRGAEFIT